MSRRIALFIVCSVIFITASMNVSAEEIKLGYLDTIKILGNYKETQEAEEIYKKEVEAWKKEAEEKEAEIAQLREEIQSQSLMLSEDKLAEKRLLLEQKLGDYQQYMENTFGENGVAARRNNELLEPIMEKINNVITQIAEEDGYTIILDSAQGNIIWAKKSIDVTEKVMERLNQQLQSLE